MDHSFTIELERLRRGRHFATVPEAPGGHTVAQRAWLIDTIVDAGSDRMSAEIILDHLLNEGVAVTVPEEECHGCGATFSADQMHGAPFAPRFCPTCNRSEVDADHAFDARRG